MGKYDIAMRTLMAKVDGGCGAFLGQIGIAGPLRTLQVKLPKVSAREVDFLAEGPDGVIYHVEFQAQNDPSMHARMLAYAALVGERVMIDRADRFPVRRGKASGPLAFPEIRQFLVYIGRGAPTMEATIDRPPTLQFRYDLVNALDLDPTALLDSPAVGDAIMAILCKDGTKPDMVRRILSRIDGLEPFRRNQAYEQLLILSELRGASGVIEMERGKMNIQVDLNKIESYRKHADEASLEVLVQVLRERFGNEAVSSKVFDRLGQLGSKEITALAGRAVKTETIDEFLQGVPEQHDAVGPKR